MEYAGPIGLKALGGEDALREKYLIFTMGEELYGVEIRHVIEIVGMQPITGVPEMPTHIRGIINLRGTIVPVMDARLRLKRAACAYDGRTCIIVLDLSGFTLGLIVDRVAEVLAIPDADIAPPPGIGMTGSACIKGIARAGGGVRVILDAHQLLREDERDRLDALS